jgi:hypothetical protein
VFAAPPLDAGDGGVCPGAVLEGAAEAFGSRGYVEIVDAGGQIIDSVAW